MSRAGYVASSMVQTAGSMATSTPSDPTTFVVRVPVIAGARLHLKGGSANVDAGFDLMATLADNVHLRPVDLADVALVNSLPPAGNPVNRVNLLIMGDGYTAAQSAKFCATDAGDVADRFFNISPYAEYKNYVNIQTLFLPSPQ